jgi:hypothetical protein
MGVLSSQDERERKKFSQILLMVWGGSGNKERNIRNIVT